MLLKTAWLFAMLLWQHAMAHSQARSGAANVMNEVLAKINAIAEKISDQEAHIAEQGRKIEILESKLHQLKEEVKKNDLSNVQTMKRNISATNKRQLNLNSAILSYLKNSSSSTNTTAPSSGSVYTRWGRTKCDRESTLLYSGFAAGAYYNNHGAGGADLQCMPLDPEYDKFGFGGSYALLHGTEYESGIVGIFSDRTDQQNIPCARCYAPRSASMMIPAKRTCPKHWSKEYEGYMMTGKSVHPYNYVCVDASPEYIIGQHGNTNGALLYFVKPDCDGDGTTGHCPPYEIDKQLTCVICTK